jgi:hypothetical protein
MQLERYDTMKKTILTLAAIALLPALASASVTLNLSAGALTDSKHAPLIDGTLTLLADADGDGFGDLAASTQSWLVDEDDVLLLRSGLNDWLGVEGSHIAALQFDLTDGLNPGDSLMLVWYDLPYSDSAMGPGEGVAFGTYPSDEVLDGSTSAWEIPADGSTIALNFLTPDAGGESPASAAAASQMTVPEPAAMAVLGLGGLFVARRRRKA